MKHYILISSLLVCTARILPLDFLDTHFEGFKNRVVNVEDRVAFDVYYHELMNKQKSTKNKRSLLHKDLDSFEQLGRNSLEVKNPGWANQLRPYLNKKIVLSEDKDMHHAIKRFLIRYGAYQEFLKEKMQKEQGFWRKTCAYVQDMGNRVGHIVTRWRRAA